METGASQEPSNPDKPEDAGSGSLTLADQNYDPKAYKEEVLNERRCKAYTLRIIEKKTYADIGKILGVSEFTAHADVKTIQKQRMAQLVEMDKALIVKHDEVYEAIIAKWLPIAISEDEVVTTEEGQRVLDDRPLGATDRVIKALAEQAKLHGLGQQGKISSPSDLGQAIGDHVLRAMRELASGKFSGRGEKVIEGEIVTHAIEDANTEHADPAQGS